MLQLHIKTGNRETTTPKANPPAETPKPPTPMSKEFRKQNERVKKYIDDFAFSSVSGYSLFSVV